MYQRPVKTSDESSQISRDQQSLASSPPAQRGKDATKIHKDLVQSLLAWIIVITMFVLSIYFLWLGGNLIWDGIHGALGDKSTPRMQEAGAQKVIGSSIDPQRYKSVCPNYKHYALIRQ